MRFSLLATMGIAILSSPDYAAEARSLQPVELIGHAHDFKAYRVHLSYYWADDFTFLLDDAQGKTWRIISREPTPAYEWRMGPTYTGLAVDWKLRPRVKVIGVRGVDRIPSKFHELNLQEPLLATALLVLVENKAGEWKEFYVNNWFHAWGHEADRAIHAHYADKPDLYRIYGFARGQSAPFDAPSQVILDKNKTNPSLMFHGRVKRNANQPFGYEIHLIDLIGRDVKTGGPVLLHGNARTIPKLEAKK